jgi:hypothetical protein
MIYKVLHWGSDDKRHTSFRIAYSQEDALEKSETTIDKVFRVSMQRRCLLTGEHTYETIYQNDQLLTQFYNSR